MHTPSDLPLTRPFRPGSVTQEAVVQDRPPLGAMPLARRGVGWWLLPGVDLVSSSLALTLIALLAGVAVLPALPVAPLVLVLAYSLLGVYGSAPSKGALAGADGAGWPVIRFVVAALFAWAASLMMTISAGEQLALWAAFIAVDTIARA